VVVEKVNGVVVNGVETGLKVEDDVTFLALSELMASLPNLSWLRDLVVVDGLVVVEVMRGFVVEDAVTFFAFETLMA